MTALPQKEQEKQEEQGRRSSRGSGEGEGGEVMATVGADKRVTPIGLRMSAICRRAEEQGRR